LVPGDYVGQGKIMDLTATEHRLLTCLARNAGRTVSHRELLEVMRSGKPGSSMGNLRQCIWRLRKKIEIDPALPRVNITQHGEGYCFTGKEEARWFPEGEWL